MTGSRSRHRAHTLGVMASCTLALLQTIVATAAGGDAAAQTVIGMLYDSQASGNGEPTVSRHLNAAEFGERWPLSAPAIDVVCVLSKPHETLLIVLEGKPFALNDATRRNAAEGLQIDISGTKVAVDASADQQAWRIRDSDDPMQFKSMTPVVEAASRIGCLRKGESGGID